MVLVEALKMTEPKTSEAFRTQTFLMTLAGVWPIKNSTFSYNSYGFFISFLIQNLFILPSILLFVLTSVNVGQGSFILFCNIATVCYQLKLGVFCINRKTFCKILQDLEQPLFRSQDRRYQAIVNQAIALSKRITTLMYFPTIFFAVLLGAYPALDRSTERPLPFPLPFDLEQIPYSLYVGIYCMEVVAGGVATFTNTNLDTLACTLMILCSAQLKILGKKLHEIATTNSKSDNKLEDYGRFDDLTTMKLRDCVQHHIAITRYIEKLEETFTYEYLAQFITGLLLICTAGFSFVVIPITDVMFATAASFFTVASIEIAIYCIFGNEIIVQSSEVRNCCYMSEWNQCGPAVCKTLIIMMERTKRPLVLTAGKFADLSHESLIAILKSSFSYFVVIRKLYGEQAEIK